MCTLPHLQDNLCAVALVYAPFVCVSIRACVCMCVCMLARARKREFSCKYICVSVYEGESERENKRAPSPTGGTLRRPFEWPHACARIEQTTQRNSLSQNIKITMKSRAASITPPHRTKTTDRTECSDGKDSRRRRVGNEYGCTQAAHTRSSVHRWQHAIGVHVSRHVT